MIEVERLVDYSEEERDSEVEAAVLEDLGLQDELDREKTFETRMVNERHISEILPWELDGESHTCLLLVGRSNIVVKSTYEEFKQQHGYPRSTQ